MLIFALMITCLSNMYAQLYIFTMATTNFLLLKQISSADENAGKVAKMVANGKIKKEDASGALDEMNKTNPTVYKKEFGFIAQDVKELFPELVEESTDGLLSVNYIGLIPLLLESIKEQRQMIDNLSKTIEGLEKSIAGVNEGSILRSSTEDNSSFSKLNGVSSKNAIHAILYQNAPNPFKERTEIRYYLPSEIKTAEIYIFNLQGGLLKKIPASHSGIVDIKGSDLQAGIYLYSLIVDGNEVDTKRMILTK